MYILYPAFDHEKTAYCVAGRDVRRAYQGLGEIAGIHKASLGFPDPEECWAPGSKGQPKWNKILLNVEAELEIPATCTGSIIARTTLRDVQPGGASLWAAAILFGVSDGTHIGGEEKATKVVEANGNSIGTVEFEKAIPWDGKSCTARNDVFVYVKMASGGKMLTFIEIGFFPRVKSAAGVPVDNSPNPKIRLHPCDNLTPIRSRYDSAKESQQYLKLPKSERKQVLQKADRVFREETGITRNLDPHNPKDLPLVRHWLRIRDRLVSEKN